MDSEENISTLFPTDAERPVRGLPDGVLGSGFGVVDVPKPRFPFLEGVRAREGGRDDAPDGVLYLELDPLSVLEKESGGGGPWFCEEE